MIFFLYLSYQIASNSDSNTFVSPVILFYILFIVCVKCFKISAVVVVVVVTTSEKVVQIFLIFFPSQ